MQQAQSTETIINNTVSFVKHNQQKAEGGHDWWHIYRVWQTAKKIAVKEKANLLVVELAALLHDIADAKFHDGAEDIGPQRAANYLNQQPLDTATIAHVVQIIANISFKGGKEAAKFRSLEMDVVQDADRLDAMGAIGIARAFNYGGFRQRALYDPNIPPDLAMDKHAYRNSQAPTINHFYEKLLLLKYRMNTQSGQQMAEERHAYMEGFLKQFYAEWNG